MENKEKFTQNFLVELGPIEYSLLANIAVSLIMLYSTKKWMKDYNIRREYKPKNIGKVILPPELTQEYSDVDIKKWASQKFGAAVSHFVEVMKDKFPTTDLTNFYNNLNELKINSKDVVLRPGVSGIYNARNNEIYVDEDEWGSTALYHELFHMSSRTFKDEVAYCGFKQVSDDFYLAEGINEGYTQLLTERYFDDNTPAYIYQVYVVDKLEKIVGQEKMESLYLNSNLFGLVTELKKYVSEEEISKFISDTDFLHEILHKQKKVYQSKNKRITSAFNDVNDFLLKAYIKMICNQFENVVMHYDDIEKISDNYAAYGSSLIRGLKKCKLFYGIPTNNDHMETTEKFNKIFEDILSGYKFVIDIENQNEIVSKGR